MAHFLPKELKIEVAYHCTRIWLLWRPANSLEMVLLYLLSKLRLLLKGETGKEFGLRSQRIGTGWSGGHRFLCPLIKEEVSFGLLKANLSQLRNGVLFYTLIRIRSCSSSANPVETATNLLILKRVTVGVGSLGETLKLQLCLTSMVDGKNRGLYTSKVKGKYRRSQPMEP